MNNESQQSPPKASAGALPFVAVGHVVKQGSEVVARARSVTMARRIANALNQYKPNQKGY